MKGNKVSASNVVRLADAKKGVTSSVETITPAKAQKYLDNQVPNNRPIYNGAIATYQLAISEGRHILNGAPIIFNENDQMIDGQHRCWACVLADKPFDSVVVRGISDPKAQSTLDVGYGRSSANVFSMGGWENATTAASAASYLYYYKHNAVGWNSTLGLKINREVAAVMKEKMGRLPKRNVQRDELESFANDIREPLSVAVKAGVKYGSKVMSGSNVAALYYLFAEKDEAMAITFFDQLSSGIGLTKNDPVYALREKLINLSMTKGSPTRWYVCGLAIKAWNKRRANEKMSIIKVLDGEAYPRVK